MDARKRYLSIGDNIRVTVRSHVANRSQPRRSSHPPLRGSIAEVSQPRTERSIASSSRLCSVLVLGELDLDAHVVAICGGDGWATSARLDGRGHARTLLPLRIAVSAAIACS